MEVKSKLNASRTGPGCLRLARLLPVVLIISAFFLQELSAQNKLVPHEVTLENGKKFSLDLPEEFEIIPAAEGLKRVRFFAKAPDGRYFVTGIYNMSDNKRGKVIILDGIDAKTGKFGKITTYMEGLRNPNTVGFYTDKNGQDWFYLAETDKLTRRKFAKGETSPSDRSPETLAEFPDYGLSYKYGGWHLTRSIVFGNNGKLYVSVGSSCNSCLEKEKVRATVLEMNPDGSNSRIFASGLRNAVGMIWLGRYLFATNQGADHLGKYRPDETLHAVRDGGNYGWPACYESKGRIIRDRSIRGGSCRGVKRSYAFFPAHSSAMGLEYFDSSTRSEVIKDSFLVALHGSSDKSIGSGYKVVIVRKGDKAEDFIRGFLLRSVVNGRPCGILKISPDSFLLSDDHNGIVYLVRRKNSA